MRERLGGNLFCPCRSFTMLSVFFDSCVLRFFRPPRLPLPLRPAERDFSPPPPPPPPDDAGEEAPEDEDEDEDDGE